jgi:hypothetical protein
VSAYSRVYAEIWDEAWSEEERYAAFYFLTCRHRNTEGLYRLPMSYATEDMEWSRAKLDRAMRGLVGHGFIAYDSTAKVVLIVKAIGRQVPVGPKQIAGAVKAVRGVPASRLDIPFLKGIEGVSKEFAIGLREAMPNRFDSSFSSSSSPSLEGGGSKDAARDLPATTPSNVRHLDGRGAA